MGDGVPDILNELDFEPTTGAFSVKVEFSSYGVLTRTQWNDLRAAGLAAGGLGNELAAYVAIRAAWEALRAGRAAWLDRQTTGADATETGQLRRAVVWHFCARGEIPAPPQP